MLYRGQISARVPEGAIGFRIDAPGVNVVDLGTEFSLAVDAGGPPKVHVFKGKVRAGVSAKPLSQLELNTGESARVDVAQGTVVRGFEDPSLFPALENFPQAPRTTGDVRYLRRAPESLLVGTYEHDMIMVFEEKADVVLSQPFSVIRNVSNQQEGAEPSVAEWVTIPAGTRVKSYLVHFDRIGGPDEDLLGTGSISFDQPVLGFVTLQAMNDSTALFGNPRTTYARDRNGLEMRFLGTPPNIHSKQYDEVHFSTDRRKVVMRLLIAGGLDEFRILVKAE